MRYTFNFHPVWTKLLTKLSIHSTCSWLEAQSEGRAPPIKKSSVAYLLVSPVATQVNISVLSVEIYKITFLSYFIEQCVYTQKEKKVFTISFRHCAVHWRIQGGHLGPCPPKGLKWPVCPPQNVRRAWTRIVKKIYLDGGF